MGRKKNPNSKRQRQKQKERDLIADRRHRCGLPEEKEVDEYICLLVTVGYHLHGLDGNVRCALKIKRELLPDDFDERTEGGRKQLQLFLPLHVRNCGSVMAAEELFEVAVIDK